MEKTGLKHIDELISKAVVGDGTAFTELWDTHITALRMYLHGAIKNLDDFFIEDICSRSFEKAFRQIGTFEPSKSRFSTWLRKIAFNTALDTLQQENRARFRYVYLDEPHTGSEVVDNISDGSDTPLETIIKDEDHEKTLHYVESLPELYREVARLRLVEGRQYGEIAEELDLELNTVRTRIRRAKALIDNMKDD